MSGDGFCPFQTLLISLGSSRNYSRTNGKNGSKLNSIIRPWPLTHCKDDDHWRWCVKPITRAVLWFDSRNLPSYSEKFWNEYNSSFISTGIKEARQSSSFHVFATLHNIFNLAILPARVMLYKYSSFPSWLSFASNCLKLKSSNSIALLIAQFWKNNVKIDVPMCTFIVRQTDMP